MITIEWLEQIVGNYLKEYKGGCLKVLSRGKRVGELCNKKMFKDCYCKKHGEVKNIYEPYRDIVRNDDVEKIIHEYEY